MEEGTVVGLARPRYRVVTATAPPFVMLNASTGTFYGYCIDLLHEMQSLLGFDYDIKQSPDNKYGDLDPSTGLWNGAIHELMTNSSDILLGPAWITADRSRVVDFTIPFYRQTGFTIMMRKPVRHVPFLRFLTILETNIWIGFALAYLLTTILIFAYERFSPFSYRNSPERYMDEPDDRFRSLKECFWFTATSLTPQGCGNAPKNLSGKFAAATWWLFSFVIVAAYTANLAAYETLARLERRVESLEDLRRQYEIEYSTMADSSATKYFRAKASAEALLYRMWRALSLNESLTDVERMEYVVWDYPLDDTYTKMYTAIETTGFVRDLDEALSRVRKENSSREYAFIGNARSIKYLILTNCGLRQVGEEFSKRPLAFAVQKGSPLRDRLNEALHTLAMQRRMQALERKWWTENPARKICPADKEVNAGFGLDNMAAAFLLILVGTAIACLVLCLEYCWYRLVPRRQPPVSPWDFAEPRAKNEIRSQASGVDEPETKKSRRAFCF